MSERKIPMVDLLGQYREIETEILAEVKEVMENTAFINGPAVHDFSMVLKDYLDSPHIITCGNGTDALQIALMALDLPRGAKVAVPAFTYVATVEVIALLKLTPVFIEVDPDTFNMDSTHLEEVIQQHELSAIIPVHLYGQSADMNRIGKLGKDSGIPVIEDNAQAIGADYQLANGEVKKTGTMGSIGTFSFFPSKNLGAFGDGGALSTNDTDLAKRMKMIANHGQSSKYIHDLVGLNSRLDTLQAAILKVKLKHLDDYISRRQEVADRYDREFSDLSGLEIPARDKASTHVFHQYTIKIETGERDRLKEFLATKNIPSIVYYPVAQHLQKAYEAFAYKEGSFPVSEQLCKKVLSLPIHTQMKEDDLTYICEHVKAYFNG